jgi:hypothetical protein
MTGRKDAAWLADLAEVLTEVDEFLRSPAGHAALEGYYAARGPVAGGYGTGLLIDSVGFTALWLRNRGQGQRS